MLITTKDKGDNRPYGYLLSMQFIQVFLGTQVWWASGLYGLK